MWPGMTRLLRAVRGGMGRHLQRSARHPRLRVTDLLPRTWRHPICIAARTGRTIGDTSSISMTPCCWSAARRELCSTRLCALQRHKGGTKERADRYGGMRLWAGVHAGNERAQRSNDDINDDILVRRRQTLRQAHEWSGRKGTSNTQASANLGQAFRLWQLLRGGDFPP
jgi:hypothetical protein